MCSFSSSEYFCLLPLMLHCQTITTCSQWSMTRQGGYLLCFNLIRYKWSFPAANGASCLVNVGEDFSSALLTGPFGGEGMESITRCLSIVTVLGLVYAHMRAHAKNTPRLQSLSRAPNPQWRLG